MGAAPGGTIPTESSARRAGQKMSKHTWTHTHTHTHTRTHARTQTHTHTHTHPRGDYPLSGYCNRRNFSTRFNFVYFVLLAESTKISSIRKPCTYTSVCDTAFKVRKFIAYENSRTLEYEIFTRTKISAITVYRRVPMPFCILLCIEPGAVKLVLWRHWMHVAQVHPVTSENQFHCTILYYRCTVCIW